MSPTEDALNHAYREWVRDCPCDCEACNVYAAAWSDAMNPETWA